jgi:hypothetical protein
MVLIFLQFLLWFNWLRKGRFSFLVIMRASNQNQSVLICLVNLRIPFSIALNIWRQTKTHVITCYLGIMPFLTGICMSVLRPLYAAICLDLTYILYESVLLSSNGS